MSTNPRVLIRFKKGGVCHSLMGWINTTCYSILPAKNQIEKPGWVSVENKKRPLDSSPAKSFIPLKLQFQAFFLLDTHQDESLRFRHMAWKESLHQHLQNNKNNRYPPSYKVCTSNRNVFLPFYVVFDTLEYKLNVWDLTQKQIKTDFPGCPQVWWCKTRMDHLSKEKLEIMQTNWEIIRWKTCFAT